MDEERPRDMRLEEERLREMRLERLQRASEADDRRKKHEMMQEKLRCMGRCPAGFRWYRSEGGWRCHGGSHWVGAQRRSGRLSVQVFFVVSSSTSL